MVFIPTPYTKVSISYDLYLNTYNIKCCKNAYKANALLLLLSSNVTVKYLQYSIDITTEQKFRYLKLANAKIWISKMHHYVEFLQIESHVMLNLQQFTNISSIDGYTYTQSNEYRTLAPQIQDIHVRKVAQSSCSSQPVNQPT